MDQTYREFPGNPVVVTGIDISVSDHLRGFLLGKEPEPDQDRLVHDCRPLRFLRQKKTLKFMSKQDRLALEAACPAVEMSSVSPETLRERSGVFLTVGYIPFELETARELCHGSMENNRFSMEKFTGEAIENINPLLAFACLPNMPAHHVAMNLEILGSYLITYPDTIQLYVALHEALLQLQEGRIDLALVGAVADQSNFLVRHHFEKVHNHAGCRMAADCAGFLVLERKSQAEERKAKILMQIESLATEPININLPSQNRDNHSAWLGPAELILSLFSFLHSKPETLHHAFSSDTFSGASTWRKNQ